MPQVVGTPEVHTYGPNNLNQNIVSTKAVNYV